jgi:hypothetical protein
MRSAMLAACGTLARGGGFGTPAVEARDRLGSPALLGGAALHQFVLGRGSR